SASSFQSKRCQAARRIWSTNQARSSTRRRISRPARKRASRILRALPITFLKAAMGLDLSASSAWNWLRSNSSGSTCGMRWPSFEEAGWGNGSGRCARDGVVLAQRDYLVAIGGDHDGVLPLRRQFPILGDGGPAIAQQAGLGASLIDHRLDGEGHAFLQFQAGAGAAVMQHLRLFVEDLAD